jgi:hypothetical protein
VIQSSKVGFRQSQNVPFDKPKALPISQSITDSGECHCLSHSCAVFSGTALVG